MTTREKIHERIAKMDEAALADLLEQIERLERRRRGLSPEVFETLAAVRQRNQALSEAEAMELATEAVRWARQSRER